MGQNSMAWHEDPKALLGCRQSFATRSSLACFCRQNHPKKSRKKQLALRAALQFILPNTRDSQKKTQTAPCSKLHRFQREQPHSLSIATATGDQNHLAFIKIRRAAMGKKTPK